MRRKLRRSLWPWPRKKRVRRAHVYIPSVEGSLRYPPELIEAELKARRELEAA